MNWLPGELDGHCATAVSLSYRSKRSDAPRIRIQRFCVLAVAEHRRPAAMLDSSDGALVRRLVVFTRTISMALTLADVDHVATLARLGLSDDERERMRDQLSTILEHIGELSQLDTDSIPPTASVTRMTNVWREDAVRPSLTSEQVFQNAPRVSDDCFVVRTPLGSEGDEA